MAEPIRRIIRNFNDLPKFVFYKDDKKLHAGGIIIYDDEGLWVLKEYFKIDSYKITDPGGKYNYQDCDIYNTIIREFCEETYLSCNFTYFDLISLIRLGKTQEVYVCPDLDKQPTYLCILVHRKDIEEVKGKKIVLDNNVFHENRIKVLKANPHVPEIYFSSFDFYHLKFNEISKNMSSIHFRLKQVLHKSFMKKYLFDNSQQVVHNCVTSDDLCIRLEKTEICS